MYGGAGGFLSSINGFHKKAGDGGVFWWEEIGSQELKGHWNIKREEEDDLEKDGKIKFNTIKI